MLKFTKNQEVDHIKYLHRLQVLNYIYFNKRKAREAVRYHKVEEYSKRMSCIKLMEADSSNEYNYLESKEIYNLLKEVYHCPTHYFSSDNVQGYSLSKDTVLVPLYENGYAQEFLEEYLSYVETKSAISGINNMIGRIAENGEDFNRVGEPLARMPFTVSQQKNARYYYKQESIIQIPKIYNDCIQAPDDEILVWSDLDQADYRIFYNLFLKTKENLKLMRNIKDAYAGQAQLLAESLGEEFNLENFKAERDVMKVSILATTYGRSNDLVRKKSAFIKKYNTYLDKQPKYVQYRNILRQRCESSDAIPVTSYFGHVENIFVHRTSGRDQYKNTINDALNSPIQATTSGLIILLTNSILDKFYEIGYTEEDISVYFTRHDEVIFRMKRKCLKDAWIFNNSSSIQIDDWIPMTLKFFAGTSYKDVDEDIMSQMEEVYKANEDKIDIFEPTEHVNYLPVQPVLSIGVWCSQVGSDVVCTVYDAYSLKRDTFILGDTNVQDATDRVLNLVTSKEKFAYDSDCSGMVIYTTRPRDEYYGDYSKVTYTGDGNPRVMAQYHNEYYATKYALKNGLVFRSGFSYDTFVEINDRLNFVEGGF